MIANVRPLHGDLSSWRPITEDLSADLFQNVNMSITGCKQINRTCCRQQLWHLGRVNNYVDDLKYKCTINWSNCQSHSVLDLHSTQDVISSRSTQQNPWHYDKDKDSTYDKRKRCSYRPYDISGITIQTSMPCVKQPRADRMFLCCKSRCMRTSCCVTTNKYTSASLTHVFLV